MTRLGAGTFDAHRLGIVVERSYDAVLRPELWPMIFQDFAEATHSTGLTCFQFGTDSQKGRILCSRSLDESVETYVNDGWYARNPRLVRAARVSSLDRLITDKDLSRVRDSLDEADRAWRNDFLQQNGLGWFAGTDFEAGQNSRIGMSVERSCKLQPFQSGELEIMQRALVQVRRALSFAPALDNAAAQGLMTGLETTGQAAALLDRTGRVILLNARGKTRRPNDPGPRRLPQGQRAPDESATAAIRREPRAPGSPLRR